MSGAILHYFRFGEKTSTPLNSARTLDGPTRALPSSWFTSPEMYEFERRAIFSRRWLFITHSSRFTKAGDFLRYNVAGYDLMIIRDRTGNINAFHNVCRHRAYPVIEKDEGNARILACKYHGWSYGINGKLAKAPGFQDYGDFQNPQNGLFRIHVRIDRKGFVWINMDAKDEPEVPWEEHFANMDAQQRYESVNFDDYELDHTYQLEGDYNWKIAADNFNECYHCPTAHSDIPALMNPSLSYDYEDQPAPPSTDPVAVEEATRSVNSTYFFPNASMSVSPHMIMIQKFLPVSASKSILAYEIFRNKYSSEQDFKLVSETYARVMAEDKVLCNRAQKNLNSGVFVSGLMHPKFEKAPLFIQQACREAVTEHFNREKREGREIWPARQVIKGSGIEGVSTEDDMICAGIKSMCQTPQTELLAW